MQTSPWILLCGVVCIWPMFFGIIGFGLGRYRVRLRNPIMVETAAKRTSAAQKAGVGFGPPH